MTRSHQFVPDLLDGPPPEVLLEIDAAWERAQALSFELHFVADPLRHRAFGELRREDGTVEHRLSAAEAVALACGDPVAVPEPALAV